MNEPIRPEQVFKGCLLLTVAWALLAPAACSMLLSRNAEQYRLENQRSEQANAQAIEAFQPRVVHLVVALMEEYNAAGISLAGRAISGRRASFDLTPAVLLDPATARELAFGLKPRLAPLGSGVGYLIRVNSPNGQVLAEVIDHVP